MQEDSEQLLVGRISGIYGVKGWFRVFSYTRPPENILNYTPWHLRQGDIQQVYALKDGRVQGKGLVASVEGIDDREIARALIGADILIDRSLLQPLPEGEFYWDELLGLEVVNQQGEKLGKLVEILETGANDVLVVSGKTRELIPWVWGRYLLDVDLATGKITVDWQGQGE